MLINYSLILLIKKSNDEAIVVINPSGYKTQREISQKLNISRSYVSRIEKKALKKLRKELKSEKSLE